MPAPDVIEAAFARRSRYKAKDSDEIFPTLLDSTHDPRSADIVIGSSDSRKQPNGDHSVSIPVAPETIVSMITPAAVFRVFRM